jgi:hypothetical protein
MRELFGVYDVPRAREELELGRESVRYGQR